ncbi:A/G-specific adenine glycosylase [Aquibacillus sediminis]|uniref:A/G-specific adenine glycosylase n=1 Tax=Aquibacillus sediminis TaxID=2574734 RepID=UPI001109E556|nr:A/G-specific adenine glycosylase [Aquibacillus sediminis]
MNDQKANQLKNFNIKAFQSDLIDWFLDEKRDLPWRKDQDPYKVWVSEIMLQQTKVDTVIPYFNRFMEKFPTLKHLAEADEQEVLKEWEGLGYYSRARNLQTAVKEVVETYNSKVPDDRKELASLKGVGPYTTGAILSIAYGIPEPAVDGNVMRVLSRVLRIEEDIAKPKARRVFETHLHELISKQDPSSFNQGLMELGALICTPKAPSCLLCPVQQHCRAFAEGVQEQLPIKSKKKKQKKIPYFTFVIKDAKDADGKVLIEKRPEDGLLANMWQFPMVEKTDIDIEFAAAWIEQMYGLPVVLGEQQTQIKHVFSHVIWEIDVFVAQVDTEATAKQGLFVTDDELAAYPFPVPHQKIIKHMGLL